jgi:hypothetical protein
MDVLSIDGFKILIWVLALLVTVGVYFGFFRQRYWALVSGAFTFIATAAGIGLYILMHVTDPRWSGNQQVIGQPPKLSETPIIGQYLEPLGTFLNQTASSINDFVAFQHALPVAQEFFAYALWGFVAFVPLMILALVMSRLQPLLLEKKVKEQQADLKRLTRAVNDLRAEQGLSPLD